MSLVDDLGLRAGPRDEPAHYVRASNEKCVRSKKMLKQGSQPVVSQAGDLSACTVGFPALRYRLTTPPVPCGLHCTVDRLAALVPSFLHPHARYLLSAQHSLSFRLHCTALHCVWLSFSILHEQLSSPLGTVEGPEPLLPIALPGRLVHTRRWPT